MDRLIRDTLNLLGLSSKEISFFEASFKLGPSTVNEIAKRARLERSTAYLISKSLVDKGLIQEDLKTYGQKLAAVEPRKLLTMLSARSRSIQRKEMELEENLPSLQSLYTSSDFRPNARVFQGTNGLLTVWKDILEVKQEILIWTNQQTESLFFHGTKHDQFIKERIKKGITARTLTVNNEAGRLLLHTDEVSLRQTKLLPESVDFSAETYIYGNKVAVLDYDKEIIGIVIESKSIAQAQKAIFELAWNSA
jgi:sugar-specific transcriptional regulator TrmB